MRRLAWTLAAPFLAWWGVWLAAVLAGLGAVRRAAGAVPPAANGTLDVIIPAHDEEANLPVLLTSLGLPEGAPGVGRVVVVADHCTDRTAEVAGGLGATVLRRDHGPRGKPAALRDAIAAHGPPTPRACCSWTPTAAAHPRSPPSCCAAWRSTRWCRPPTWWATAGATPRPAGWRWACSCATCCGPPAWPAWVPR
ncbi:MAG: hypothetical protein U0Y82_08665 [Thermoleophilia bacterium]